MANTCVKCKGKTFFTQWTNTYRCFKCEKEMRAMTPESQAIEFKRQ